MLGEKYSDNIRDKKRESMEIFYTIFAIIHAYWSTIHLFLIMDEKY